MDNEENIENVLYATNDDTHRHIPYQAMIIEYDQLSEILRKTH